MTTARECCTAKAKSTNRRCRNPRLPGSDRCTDHPDRQRDVYIDRATPVLRSRLGIGPDEWDGMRWWERELALMATTQR